jgi:hypothetical protein
MGTRRAGVVALPLMLAAVAALAAGACSVGSSRSVGETAAVSAKTVATFVARADRALGSSFSATYRTTTVCGPSRSRCTQQTEVWQLSRYHLVERTGPTNEVVFPGPYTCQQGRSTQGWSCRPIEGMGASMTFSNYPPELLEGDLDALRLVVPTPVHLTHKDVNGRVSQCLLFGPVQSPYATACIDADGLVDYLSTSVGPDNGFEGTLEMTGFSRNVARSVFELPGPISTSG